jgi:hypothetical protein
VQGIPITKKRFKDCIEVCRACEKECRAYVAAVMPSEGMSGCVRACREAAVLCELCITDLCSDSPLLVYSSRMCASSCERCVSICSEHETAASSRCAMTCRRCAEECRKVRVWLGESRLA